MYATRWADDRESFNNEDEWHYKDYPFVLDEGDKSVNSISPFPENIEFAFHKNLDIFSDSTKTDQEKSDALLWLFHIVGDAHQPLHSISLFSTDFPLGDAGGTELFFGHNKTQLHGFWDSIVINLSSMKLKTQITKANLASIIGKAKFLIETNKESDFSEFLLKSKVTEWTGESYEIAKKEVYQDIILNGSIIKKVNISEYNKRLAEYDKNTKQIAEKRLTIAGFRLTDLCKILAEKIP